MAKRGRPFGAYGHYKKNGVFNSKLIPERQAIEAPMNVFGGVQMQPKLPVGLAEHAGLDFDSAFGLGRLNAPDEFASKVGIDPGFGRHDYDIGFTKAFMQGEFQQEQPHLISNNYSEPNESNMVSNSVPNVIEASKQLTIGKRIPLTDQEADEMKQRRRRREVSPRSALADIRVKEIQGGSNYLSGEEKRLYEAGYTIDGERYDTRRRSMVGSGQ